MARTVVVVLNSHVNPLCILVLIFFKKDDIARERLFGKKVSVKLLSKDQYGRVVGLVKYKEPKIGPLAFLFGGAIAKSWYILQLDLLCYACR